LSECADCRFKRDGVMVVRALICCTALILGLLAALSATAQSASACNGAACRSAEKARPLDLMSFMRGRAKADTKAGRPPAAKTAAHSPQNRHAGRSAGRADRLPDVAPETQPASLPAAAYAAETRDVQVVTGDQLNVIDLAMSRTTSETVGAAPRFETREGTPIKLADAGAPRDIAPKLDSNPDKASAIAPRDDSPRGDSPRDDSACDDSWIGRFWAAIGDSFVVLVAMVRQLFA
jgi:hypothetical protein